MYIVAYYSRTGQQNTCQCDAFEDALALYKLRNAEPRSAACVYTDNAEMDGDTMISGLTAYEEERLAAA